MGKVVVNTANDLIAAVPALLGYPPVERVSLAFITEREVLFVAAPPMELFPGEIDLFEGAARNGADRVIVIVATEEPMSRVRTIVDDIERQARQAGVQMLRAVHLPEYTMGAQFTDVRTGEMGLLNDPSTSPVAADRVMSGRRLHASRAEIERRFELTEEAEPMLATSEPFEQFAARTLNDAVDAVMLGEPVGAELAARVGRLVVRSRTARDALVGVGAIGCDLAATVMVDIANQLRGQMRVEVLAVAAIMLYVAEDGVPASVAVTTAAQYARAEGIAEPPLLSLLIQALGNAVEPRVWRRLIDVGVVVADDSYRVFIPQV
ncbi:DUF4192 domain-containing protein [Nocardia sp. NPDC058176]|uniref:DUF4192 domain-containing protein n=1 Tax=Nocardia sp. NPDC058176 TaxID=3346368 RepID=UPI0036DA6F4C